MQRVQQASETATEHSVVLDGHTTFYLDAGPRDGPLMLLVHGWPELSLSWRHQLPAMAALGFRVVAPDMRGYGRSSVYDDTSAYALENVVADVLALVDHLERQRAVLVGHDWGSAVVWSLASHHPARSVGVASLCVPYWTIERGLDALLPLVDRDVYPADRFPAGQWEYMRLYEEQFAAVTRVMDANPHNLVQALFRKGNRKHAGKPATTAHVRNDGGWFRGASEAPAVPRDADVVSAEDLLTYADALRRNGFRGPNAWYMNHATNARYSDRAVNDGRLDMPVLFLGANYDYVCETATSRLTEPMHERCKQLEIRNLDCGHWMAQEVPARVNEALARWTRKNALEVASL